MEIKQRDMKITGFMDDKATKRYFPKEKMIGNDRAIVSILKFDDVKEKVEVHYNFKDEVIVDSGYTWIQIAPFEHKFWIKAMYDEKDNLVEVYIDITKENNFDNIDNPYYRDMFLDVVVPKKGHIYQMDDVELIKAYNEKLVTKEEYEYSKTLCRNLIKFLNNHHQEFLDFLFRLKSELEYELDNQ